MCREISYWGWVGRRLTLEASFGCMSHYDEPWVANTLPLNQNVYFVFTILPARSSAIPMMVSDALIHGPCTRHTCGTLAAHVGPFGTSSPSRVKLSSLMRPPSCSRPFEDALPSAAEGRASPNQCYAVKHQKSKSSDGCDCQI